MFFQSGGGQLELLKFENLFCWNSIINRRTISKKCFSSVSKDERLEERETGHSNLAEKRIKIMIFFKFAKQIASFAMS